MVDHATGRRFNDLTFDADFLTATRDSGASIGFSRLERTALTILANRPGRLLSREQLLAAMRPDPSEASDRNVDFIINRLRKKLGDSARHPRFIATQYGEGYVWIAKPGQLPKGGFLVVGPIRGLADGRLRAGIVEALEKLTEEIAGRCAVEQRIAFLPSWSQAEAGGAMFRFSVGVDLIANDGRVYGAFALRDAISQRTIRVLRSEILPDGFRPALRQIATSLTGAVWRDLALAPAVGLDPGGAPLEIRMQNAALVLSKSVNGGWSYIAERLAEEMAAAPNDPELAIMQATYLYARMLLEIDFDSDTDTFKKVEAEIEQLVLGALAAIRGNPVFRLAAAKLLFIGTERNLPLVESLVHQTLAEGTSFAAALAMRGTVQAYKGELEEAIASYDQALNFCERGSEFQVFLLVKKTMAMVADGKWAPARAVLENILEVKPQARGTMEFLYASPGEALINAGAKAALQGFSKRSATRFLFRHYQLYARHFGRPEHARNIMAGPVSHIVGRFGPAAVPESLRALCLESSRPYADRIAGRRTDGPPAPKGR